jgi:ribosomal protein S18 acetylase RimI-like enzyme
LKSGTILHKFTTKDGREVILRTPKFEDLDDLIEISRSMVTGQIISKEQEADWLKKRLTLLEMEKALILVGEVEGKVIARAEIKKRSGFSRHVGYLTCIEIIKSYRDVGIGTEMMKVLIKQTKMMDLIILHLVVASSNKRAIHVYEKVGFKETGRIPKYYLKDGIYSDDVVMVREIKL